MEKAFYIHQAKYFMKDHLNKDYLMEKAKSIFLLKCVIMRDKYIEAKLVAVEFLEIIKIIIVFKENG